MMHLSTDYFSPRAFSRHSESLATACKPLALALCKLAAWLHRLLITGVIWAVLAQAYDDVVGFAKSLPRTARIFAWAIRAGAAYKRFKTTTRLEPNSEEYTAQMEALHTEWATKLAAVCRANGGVYVKFGQFAAAFGAIPPEYRNILAQLEDKAQPRPYKDIEKMLLLELGVDHSSCLLGDAGRGALFSEFATEATAAASLAQVHRARLTSGQEVAVKLQYPGLRRSVRADLGSMRVLAAMAAMAFPEFSVSWLYLELRDKLAVELDFRNEIHNANRLRGILQKCMGVRAAAYVPAVYEQLSTERMIIMEWIQGIKLTDTRELRRASISPHAVGAALARLFAELTFVQGYVHADPHPGNLMVRPKGGRSLLNWLLRGSRQGFEIVLLDHGSYLDVSTALRERFAQLWCSFVTGDRRLQQELALALGGKRAERVLPVLLTHTAQRKQFKAMQRSVGINSVADIAQLLSTAPRDLVELLRINAVIRSSTTLLGVSMAERKRIFAWYARRGLPSRHSTAPHVHPSCRSWLYRTRLLLVLLTWTGWSYGQGVLGKTWGIVMSAFGELLQED